MRFNAETLREDACGSEADGCDGVHWPERFD
jgi:hypothetical protein